LVVKTGAKIENTDQSVAYYSPSQDYINMPLIANMKPGTFYPTLFHELAHWTGAKNRLNREGITNPTGFGSEKYANEELIAELAAAFLSAIFGIENLDQSAAYLGGWLSRLKNDSSLIVKAAAAAQKAVDYLMK
jgi:antirestriction protein ArdC